MRKIIQLPNWVLTTAITGMSTPRFPALLEAWERRRKLSSKASAKIFLILARRHFKHQAFLPPMQMKTYTKTYTASYNPEPFSWMCVRWSREHLQNPQHWAESQKPFQ